MKQARRLASVIVLTGAVTTITPFDGATPAGAATTASSCATPGRGYGRMFPDAASATYSTAATDALAAQIMSAADANPTPEGSPDAEDNPDITAGYTYFGQFVDHDLTADDRPNDLTTPTPVSSLVNLRTPQLDLDSVYGNGPAQSPQLYASDGVHLLTGSALTGGNDPGAVDLPRSPNGTAIVGDARNDENRIVAAIHSMFLRFHNRTADRVSAQNPAWSSVQVFEEARRQVVAQYQTLILVDFLPEIAGRRAVDRVVARRDGRWVTSLRRYDACMQMPVEFSVAAYRYGHSQVRSLYRVNATVDRLPVFSANFATPGSDLAGFSPSPSNLGFDWSYFFRGGRRTAGAAPQPSYKFDASLTNALSLLPLPVSSAGPADLAKRNLLRAQQLAIPTGQEVARSLGITPLRDDQILVGKATGTTGDTKAITDVSAEYAGKAPLWTYVLAEAVAGAYRVQDGAITSAQLRPFRLGPVGGAIVAETIVGLMASDPASVLNRPLPRGADTADRIKQLFDRVSDPAPSRRQPAPRARTARPPARGTRGTR